MKSKAPFILVLIGLIIGFLGSLVRIIGYFLLKNVDQGFFGSFGVDFGAILALSLVAAIIGLILSIVLIFYVIKLNGEPTKTDLIVTTVLGGLGFIFGMGIGGILVLIGGIIGLVKIGKKK